MKIDWCAGFWIVRDMKGNHLAKVRQLSISVPSELVSEKEPERKGNWHGWMVVVGTLRVEGDVGFIE